MKTKILKLEIGGIIFIILLGSLLHFTFQLSGKNILVATFSAVNESVWEHLKLVVFPAVLWLLIELKFLKEKPENFLFAKIIGIYVTPFLIVLFFYSYKAILGKNFLVLDILNFIISVILGQFFGYKLMFKLKVPKIYNKIAVGFLMILIFLFIIFTFYPIHIFLFQDSITQGFGIIR